ncbi:aldo/keto reductase [Amycolatopsis nigrescens]|uniref:aldo/keto reductase n=1 Tax=Amycolatopsis nigrescens TaxID=381445 RepID=UPI00037BD7E4|nr:aldo/keto reductase [Amycolatopsis nigrescens]
MPAPNTLTIGGDLPVHRLGFGAMRLHGDTPQRRAESVAIARRAVELGITLIDTADAYDLGGNEELLAEALHPYWEGVVVATKAGQCRPGGAWVPLGRPEYLRQQCELSLRRLRLERIELFQLHRIDPTVPLPDQIGALKRLQEEGKVRHVGLSEVSVEQLAEASRITAIASVQNRYNLTDRRSEPVLDHCERRGIAFLPWLPIAPTTRSGGDLVDTVAAGLGATRAQVALAWLLRRSPVMLPIPGTSSREHLEQNRAAADLELSDSDFSALDSLADRGAVKR